MTEQSSGGLLRHYRTGSKVDACPRKVHLVLTKWAVANFKSFNGRTQLDLAPITVLAGANSSGKSTIIQSILLLKQTIEYVPTTRPIGLNGPLLKLGRFSDIKNTNSKSETIQISWSLTDLAAYRGLNDPTYYYHYPINIQGANYSISFGISSDVTTEASDLIQIPQSNELRQLQPILQSTALDVQYTTVREGNANESSADIALGRISDSTKASNLPPTASRGGPSGALRFTVKMDSNSEKEILQQWFGSQILAASVRHFFPAQVAITYNKSRDIARKITATVSSLQSQTAFYYDPEIRKAKIPQKWIDFIIGIVGHVIEEQPPASSRFASERARDSLAQIESKDMTATELIEVLELFARRLDPRLRASVRNGLAENQDALERLYLDLTGATDEMGVEFSLPGTIGYAVDLAETFFKGAIRYLGPLRDEPRPVYPLEALVNPTDVGYRGEHTAAVLDLHRDRLVSYIPSSAAQNLIDAESSRKTLLQAVVDWLSYLGVAESVRTTDLGKIGHQLQVRAGDKSEHDLTNVGVGVSQLLPIIVMALLAPTPALLIFEQPELHLHPKVQARLADFFISLGLSGKQCLLETHSEYLIDRLRLRIAESQGESLNEKVKIYFAQKIEGNTVCTPIEISAYGAVKNWPSDFFDQSEAETHRLLEAAQRKLKNDRERKASRK